jgi:hypothetical protein
VGGEMTNVVGQVVFHHPISGNRGYGKGKIIEQAPSDSELYDYIYIKFEHEDELKKFQYPPAFIKRTGYVIKNQRRFGFDKIQLSIARNAKNWEALIWKRLTPLCRRLFQAAENT